VNSSKLNETREKKKITQFYYESLNNARSHEPENRTFTVRYRNSTSRRRCRIVSSLTRVMVLSQQTTSFYSVVWFFRNLTGQSPSRNKQVNRNECLGNYFLHHLFLNLHPHNWVKLSNCPICFSPTTSAATIVPHRRRKRKRTFEKQLILPEHIHIL